MGGIGRSLLNRADVSSDGHGDGGGEVRAGGLALFANGNAFHLRDGLANHIVRQGLGLLVPLPAEDVYKRQSQRWLCKTEWTSKPYLACWGIFRQASRWIPTLM